VANLRMRPQGLGRFVTSFERPNLHFSVRGKAGLAADLADLVEEKAGGREVEPTVVYALTTKVGTWQGRWRGGAWRCGCVVCPGAGGVDVASASPYGCFEGKEGPGDCLL
jgi:hypothetical protein